MAKKAIVPSLKNPFDPPEKVEFTIPGEVAGVRGGYEEVMKEGYDLIQRPIKSVAVGQIEKRGDLVGGEVFDPQKVTGAERHGRHPSISGCIERLWPAENRVGTKMRAAGPGAAGIVLGVRGT